MEWCSSERGRLPGDESVLKKSRGTEDQEQSPACLQLRRSPALHGASLWTDSSSLLPLYRNYRPSAQHGKAGDPTQQRCQSGCIMRREFVVQSHSRPANGSALSTELYEKALTGLQGKTEPFSCSSPSGLGAEARQIVCQVVWHRGSRGGTAATIQGAEGVTESARSLNEKWNAMARVLREHGQTEGYGIINKGETFFCGLKAD